MRNRRVAQWAAAGALCLWFSLLAGPGTALAATDELATPDTSKLDNATCLSCHEGKKDKMEVAAGDEKRALLAIPSDKFSKGAHGEMTCVACHKEITDSTAPHKKNDVAKPDCVSCHSALWETVQKEKLTKEKERLGLVVQNIEAYKKSFHARPNKDDKSHVNATCDNCHDTHTFNVPPKGTVKRTEWHLSVPNTCGEKCHSDELDDFNNSIHGKEIQVKHNPKAAVCTDCHTSHAILNTSGEPFKVDITKVCGGCHVDKLKSYSDSYHGQVNKLGYGYTAKCYDCHGSHSILKADNPASKVNPANKLKTCKQCHSGKKDLPEATAGFATFGPHANVHDYKKYPQMWITSKLMLALLGGVFAFFWVHSALWFYREYKERQLRLARPRVKADELPLAAGKQFRRFHIVWRVAHLVFALSVMVLVLTGMTVFYAETAWAPVIMNALGGPKVAGLIHRISAAIMLGIFFLHLLHLAGFLIRNRKTFKWFGPTSLVPNWKDLRDIIAMFKWTVGKGPRPSFDRWTYWEKFDYWAVFWGMGIIGGTGMLLAFPHLTASIFPGWVLNVATLVHGEEAFLAAVFLFTVHFFNNHLRPEKFPPPDIVMFTGTVSLEEFKREHSAEYQRLAASGELEKYIVDAPSRPMTVGSRILGIVLLIFGFALLALVAIGFFGSL